ncbi:hypothetical protein BDV40DRAFT_241979 [Aspergillus tamarii]|uniref:Uncharacterized protein n=1 Tax=Aspergillus tamarii TaxID=41984 RepID=A0A5N6ULS6_ASPTM|nr:hypothetical protein BDV40DRAFT_241979 [Aspergillus tamarii]
MTGLNNTNTLACTIVPRRRLLAQVDVSQVGSFRILYDLWHLLVGILINFAWKAKGINKLVAWYLSTAFCSITVSKHLYKCRSAHCDMLLTTYHF